jgi:hypothetical protein
MIGAALAPAVAFALLIAVVRPRCPDRRSTLLAAAVLWGVAVVVITEGLSLVHGLRFGPVLGAWLALGGALAWHLWRRAGAGARAPSPPMPPLSGFERALLGCVVVIAAATGVVALAAPPNTHDAMTYHMSRVAHWAQNGSVEHYPTPIVRQLAQPPWAEFAILQGYVLTSGDRLANLVQWFSMLGTAVGASLVARQLGGDRRAQLLAAVAAITLPVGVVQASGTKNDYVAAFWLTCVVALVLALVKRPAGARPGAGVVLAGSALGLALLTKATAYIVAFPLVAWACAARLRRDGWRAGFAVAALLLVAAAINAGSLARNAHRFGSPLGPIRDGPFEYANATVGLRSTLSVAIRNAGLHLGTPWGSVNEFTGSAIRAAHGALGLAVDDPSTTWWGTHFEVSSPRRHEDMVSNGLHLALVAGALLALATCADLRTPDRLAYAAALVAAFLLFCAVLRWQPWHSRLHLPLFALWAPLIGIALARWPAAAAPAATALVAVAVVMVLANEPRPLVRALREPREALYFRARPDLRQPYAGALALLAAHGCARIGLQLGGDDWEYPLWAHARRAVPEARLDHLLDWTMPGQPAARLDTGAAAPCGILATSAPERSEIALGDARYARAFAHPSIALFLRAPAGARP